MNARVIRTVIVDDEPLAREDLRAYLDQEPDVEIVGEARNGWEALKTIEGSDPDLVLLDIQMPELDGFGVVRGLPKERTPVIIFVTAHDQYAVAAFEASAVDYLLKPFDRERLRRALVKAREWLDRGGTQNLGSLRDAVAAAPRPLDRFVVKLRGRIVLVPASHVRWIEAAGNYVYLHTESAEHLVRETLAGLERQLDPARFVRIHRSTIVNLGAVKELERRGSGDYSMSVEGGRVLTLSRSFRRQFEDRLGRSL